jgi:hypothetical protein
MGQSGFQGAAGITNSGFQNSMTAYNAEQAANASMMSGIGSAVGMAAMLADGKRPRDQAIPTTPGHIAGGPGDGSGIDDQVPATIVNPQTGAQMGDARLSTDEYVIPADVVRAKGVEFFDKLLQKYHTPAAQQRAQAIPA